MSALLEIEEAHVVLAKRRVLNGVSVNVDRGDVVALLGPNGAGKSTLIRIGMGVLRLRRGRARIHGADPYMMDVELRARRAAYMPQKPESAWPVHVESLVALGRFAHGAAPAHLSEEDRIAVDAAIEACGLGALRKRRMDEISGGERVRAHLARTIAQHAPLLVLDEPTAGLDPAQSLAVAAIMEKHAAGKGGVLFSTHDISLAARAATRVLLMREGAVIAAGAPREALTPQALEAAYGRKGRLIEDGGVLAAIFE